MENLNLTNGVGPTEVNSKSTEETPLTFTQEEVDAMIKKRLKSMTSDYEELKAKADKYDQIEEESKSELQKAKEKADRLQEELNGLKKAEAIRATREEVASEVGIPVHLLTAETKEDCEAQANAIMSFAKPDEGYPKVRDAGEVRKTSSASTRDQFAEWFNEKF